MSKEAPKSNSSLIVIAIIGALSTICAASIGAMTTYNVEKLRQDSELTRIALVSTATQAGVTQAAMADILSIPTNTPQPPLPTYTLLPTSTDYPTYTPFPTNIPLPTQDISLPFSDNFDIGLSPSWRLITGTPLITDGKLKSVSGRIIIEVGNESIKNLTMTFDLSGLRFNSSDVNENDNMFLVIGKNTRFYFSNVTRMQVFENNQWVNLDGAGVDYQLQHTFKLVALDNNYEIYMDGQLLHQYQYGSSNSGPIQISMMDNVRLDNFSLSSP